MFADFVLGHFKAPPTRMPTWFIPHGGGPCFFMDWNPRNAWDSMAHYLKTAAGTLPRKPKAIVMVSAHWLETSFSVTGAEQPELIYDYYGFPPHTYELTYPAPGSPALAQRIGQLLDKTALPYATHATRGFDHGMFIPMKLMFPDATIPVVQLSLHRSLDPQMHIRLGQAIAPLRDEDVLIIGSGMSFHNMRGYGDRRFTAPSDQFDAWLSTTIAAPAEQRLALLGDWDKAPSARICHPQGAEEHLLPLMVVAGAAGNDPGRKVFSDQVMETTLSGFCFGSGQA